MAADITIYRDAATTEGDGKGYTNDIGAMIASIAYSGSGNTVGREYTLTYRSATADILVETVECRLALLICRNAHTRILPQEAA